MSDSAPPDPAQHVYREDHFLLIPKGADLSHACLICCEPSVGSPITKRLSGVKWLQRHPGSPSGSSLLLIWDVIAFLLGSIWWFADTKARHERVVHYGLCRKHRRKYFACHWSGWIGGILGFPAIIVGIFCDPHLPYWLVPVLIFGGVAGLMTAYLVPSSAPSLSLIRETPNGLLWVRGASWAFAKQYPTLPKST